MITISIDPVLFSIGPFHLQWDSLIILMTLATGLWVSIRGADRKGFPQDAIFEAAVQIIPAGLLGARLFRVIDHWPFYTDYPGKMFAICEGGLAIWDDCNQA